MNKLSRAADEAVYFALHRLQASSDMTRVLRWLEASQTDLDKKLRVATGEELYRLQGAAQLLDDLLEQVTVSRDVVRKLQDRGTQQPVAPHSFST